MQKMKRLLPLFLILVSAAYIQAQTKSPAGSIAQIKGKDIIVKYSNADKPFQIGEKLHLVVDTAAVTLEVTFPMQSSAKCRLVSGSASKLKQGMALYPGAEPDRQIAQTGDKGTNKTVTLPPSKIGDFETFLGFTSRDTIDKVTAKLGAPTKVSTHDASYSFNTAYWEKKSTKGTSGSCIRICYYKTTQKIMLIEIGSISGEDPKGSTVREFLSSIGIHDPKAEFLGVNKSKIIEVFGQPTRIGSDNHYYEADTGTSRFQTDFVCYDFNSYLCSTVTVQYFK
jgi:hypothetical protein